MTDAKFRQTYLKALVKIQSSLVAIDADVPEVHLKPETFDRLVANVVGNPRLSPPGNFFFLKIPGSKRLLGIRSTPEGPSKSWTRSGTVCRLRGVACET